MMCIWSGIGLRFIDMISISRTRGHQEIDMDKAAKETNDMRA